MKKIFLLSLAALGIWACSGTKNASTATKTEKVVETTAKVERTGSVDTAALRKSIDSLMALQVGEDTEGGVLADTLPTYQATATLKNDILHTKLDVRFDWQKQHVMGKAWITAKPYFYPQSTMLLDAQNFDIAKVTLENGKPLKYKYDSRQIVIELDKTYTRDEKYTVYIEYVAKPNEGGEGGSAAITSDKGLFFINPEEKEPNKPRQIWTQGETESNSRWFPTFDKPNEKMTNEIFITVESKFKTLSNGLLKKSANNTDGTRTDHWVMDMPHAPYLVMMAIGDFSVTTEKWRGKDIMYYVEPKYEKYVKTIYKDVPDILTFFSERLGVEYPWQKLAHITVRDYVSGAMENTTAIIYGEFMNGTDRELIDKDYNDIVVAHEMFHHWFGDLVTAESWSNLTVNESFADYSESLWLEKRYGADAADHHRQEVADGYFGQAENNTHDLVNFKYLSREDMFDAHSYNKGGSILHMLRNYMGDDAFFAALTKYLKDNSFKTGEAHQLRLALEEVAGEDLNWFFNQWYYKAGHPILDIKYDYDEMNKRISITVEQQQTTDNNTPHIFELPVSVDIYTKAGEKPTRQKIRVNQRKQTFTFDASEKPALIDFDGDRVLLAKKTDNHTEEEFAFMYNNSSRYLARYEAVQQLKFPQNKALGQAIMTKAINDKFWSIRQDAIQNIGSKAEPAVFDRIAEIAVSDTRSTTRAAAVAKLASTKDAKWANTFSTILDKDPAYNVISAAIGALYKIDPAKGIALVKKYENEDNQDIVIGIGNIYAENPNVENLDFFEKGMSKVQAMNTIALAKNYIKVLSKVETPNLVERMKKMQDIAADPTKSEWHRVSCTKIIIDVRNAIGSADTRYKELDKFVTDIIAKETSEEILNIYQQLNAKRP